MSVLSPTSSAVMSSMKQETGMQMQNQPSSRPPSTPAPSLKRRRSSATNAFPSESSPGSSSILQTVLLSKLSFTLPSPSTPLTIDFPVGILMAQVLSLGGLAAVNSNAIWSCVLRNVAAGMPNAAVVESVKEEEASGLAELYAKSVKPWEPSVFAGLLADWVTLQQAERPWTLLSTDSSPTSAKDVDEVQPNKASDFFATAHQLKVSTPLPLLANANVNPFSSLDLNLSLLANADSPAGIVHVNGDFENMLSSMQDDQERIAQIGQPAMDWLVVGQETSVIKEHQLPTPPQDKVAIRRDSDCSTIAGNAIGGNVGIGNVVYSPISMADSNSPYEPSTTSSTRSHSTEPSSNKKIRSNGPKHIGLPKEPFRPPPPMCMYFHSGFYDLQKEKIGVWKGELMVMNDAFSIMVVGEAGRGKRELWQTENWKEPLHFPSDPQAASSGDLITVTDLVRQGLVPLTMGMVLCDGQRPGEIDRFVRFVASLHSTGTAFRLASDCPLPIVFIPSKFHAEDPLQRLGLAVMGYPAAVPAVQVKGQGKKQTAIRPKAEVPTAPPAKKKGGKKVSK